MGQIVGTGADRCLLSGLPVSHRRPRAGFNLSKLRIAVEATGYRGAYRTTELHPNVWSFEHVIAR